MTRHNSRGGPAAVVLRRRRTIGRTTRLTPISPSTVPSTSREQASWTMTLTAVHRHLVSLIDLLVDSPGRWIFILDVGQPGGRYVQLLAHEDGSLLYEASSNNALEGADCLTSDQEQALASLGWTEPGGENRPNWWSAEATIHPDTRAVARQRPRDIRRGVLRTRLRHDHGEGAQHSSAR